MQGPHKLTPSNVDKKVDNDIGVYKLYNSRGGPVKFVGMSKKLAERLKDYADEYNYFEYEPQSSATKAYERQVGLFHHHGGKEKLDNRGHPPRPHNQVSCNICSIHD